MSGSAVFRNTYQLIARNAAQTPEAVAIVSPGIRAISYARLLHIVNGIIRTLKTAGVRPNDRIGIVLPDGPEMAVTLLGVSSAAVCAPLNPSYKKNEFGDCFSALDIKYLITVPDAGSPARAAADEHGIPILSMPAVKKQDSEAADFQSVFSVKTIDPQPDQTDAQPDDIAIVLQTSGTTARPKTVPLTHRNISISVRNVCRALQLVADDRCLSMMPQFHIGGFVDLLLSPLAVGSRIICVPFFDAEQFFRNLEHYRPTWYQAVPAVLSQLIAYAQKHQMGPIASSLRFIRSVASPLPPQMMAELESLFDVPVIQTFGMTEASPLITTNPLPPGIRKPGSTGLSAGPDVAVADSENNLLPAGAAGEVVVRGENLFSGYENNPEANHSAFRDGWFRTGDLGYIDAEGYLFLIGRLKEMINRGGEKISPQEIDALLLSHPKVSQAVCFAIPHKTLREDIAAAVVPFDGVELSQFELIEYLARQAAIFKVPRIIRFLEDIPKGPTGKPLRFRMAEKLGLNTPGLPEREFMPPGTFTEKALAQIWSEVLSVGEISIHDNFFDLGGDSLGVVKLFLKIEKIFYIKLPLHAIFRFPTIADLAKLIEKAEKSPLPDALKTLMVSNPMPVFWIHCTFETGRIPIIPMATYWEESPSKDISGIGIEHMANEYVNQVRAYQKNGPYRLGGYSIGGLLALETARQFADAGEQIPLLFIVDPPLPGQAVPNSVIKFLGYLKLIPGLKPETRDFYLKRKMINFFKFSNFLIKNRLCSLFWKLNKPIPYFLRVYYANKIFVQAASRYQPTVYQGGVTIYLSRSQNEKVIEKWKQLCPGADIRMTDVDDHVQMAKPPWNAIWIDDLYIKSIGTVW